MNERTDIIQEEKQHKQACVSSVSLIKGGDIMIREGKLIKKHKGDGGGDIIASKGCTIKAGGSKVVSTDLRINVPLGYAGLIHSRSGLAFNHGITAFLGVIDANYTGEVKVLLYQIHLV